MYNMGDEIMKKILVAYFSASGTTARAARILADAVGADIYEIKPAVAYTKADLNWLNKKSRSSIEMNDPASRPALQDKNADVAKYDTILVGFPIWWYSAPMIIHTFLESYDFAGKTIALFATSGGSGFGKTAQTIAKCCPGAAIKGEILLNGGLDPAALKEWVNRL